MTQKTVVRTGIFRRREDAICRHRERGRVRGAKIRAPLGEGMTVRKLVQRAQTKVLLEGALAEARIRVLLEGAPAEARIRVHLAAKEDA